MALHLRECFLGRVDGPDEFGGDVLLELFAPVAKEENAAFDDANVVVRVDFLMKVDVHYRISSLSLLMKWSSSSTLSSWLAIWLLTM